MLRIILSFAVALSFATTIVAEETRQVDCWPTWDNHELIIEYAKRAKISPVKILDLGNGVKLTAVLVPSGKFIMGTSYPLTIDERILRDRLILAEALFAIFCAWLFISAILIVFMKRRRLQLSLRRLVLLVFLAGGALLSGVHSYKTAQQLKMAQNEYLIELARFKIGDNSEKPAHLVTLSKPFYLGECTITQQQYRQANGLKPNQTNNLAAQRMTWSEAQGFCTILAEQYHEVVRLPTEAEWEYACRAGTESNYYAGDTESSLADVGWYVANSKTSMQAVRKKKPNNFNLYDMHGNVWQWCRDWYDVYSPGDAIDPNGPEDGKSKVARGGSWLDSPMRCRSSYRIGFNPSEKNEYVGLRVVIELSK